MRAKIIEGRKYYNPFRDFEFTVIEINRTTVKCIKEDGSVKDWNKSELQAFLQNSVDRKLKNWEWNIENNISLMIQNDDNDPCEMLDRIGELYEIDIPTEWKDSRYEWFLRLPNPSKGAIIRRLYCSYIESKGYEVERNENNNEAELNPIVDGRKKCLKSACMKQYEPNNFNNIRQFQNWEDIVFVCIYPNSVEFWEVEKDLFIAYLEENPNEVMWAGGIEKKERLDNDISKNDYFQWVKSGPMPDDVLTRL